MKLASKTNKGGGPHLGSRYKCDALDEDLCDFSRDDDLCGQEDIGIGHHGEDEHDEDDIGNVLFDDEDLFGDKADRKALKQNRSKMLLDELEGGAGGPIETDNSFRQQTMQDDETGALNSDRAMVPITSAKKK